MRKLTQLSAFWNRNQPHGIEITLRANDGDLDDLLQAMTAKFDTLYQRAAHESRLAELLTDVYSALRSIGLADKSLPVPQVNRDSAIASIWLLERYGFLQPDEFNGLELEFED
jgi:hypothetical protein